ETVTYGVNSSPYLAIRTLLQLAEEGKERWPLASHVLKTDIYVDDLVCGASSVETALQLRDQLIALLGEGCFELRKWSSNHAGLLKDIPASHCQIHHLDLCGDFPVIARDTLCTKRAILSQIARIYDPLGFLSPLTLFAKRILQILWTLGLDWDDTPPQDIVEAWSEINAQISCLETLHISRRLFPSSFKSCQLHAFCDASEVGYACVIYLRGIREDNQTSIRLVMAKSKIPSKTPIDSTIRTVRSIVDFVLSTYRSTFPIQSPVIAWSDSLVALTWIRALPHRWKSFIANSTSFIQEHIAPSCWRYVPSSDNPADPASRGLFHGDLQSCSQPPDFWPDHSSNPTTVPEIDLEEKSVALIAQTPPSIIYNLLTKIFFVTNFKAVNRRIDPLSAEDLHNALMYLVKIVQSEAFTLEIAAIRDKRLCPKYLQKLSPFIDNEGILRVGGRLANSDLPYNTKYPALLPRRHRLTELIINQIHIDNFHPGVNTTMYLVQQNVWIISSRRAIRHYLSPCNRCFLVMSEKYQFVT
ncbi:hypothetical protein NQ318_013208, partial [Aromia moschata]